MVKTKREEPMQASLWPSHGLAFLQEQIDHWFLNQRAARHFSDLAHQFALAHPEAVSDDDLYAQALAEGRDGLTPDLLWVFVPFGLWLCQGDHLGIGSDEGVEMLAIIAELSRRKMAGEALEATAGGKRECDEVARMIYLYWHKNYFSAGVYLLLVRIFTALRYS